MIINVIVAEKNAIAMPHEALVCGNSDYIIEFDFDEEWDQHPTKTARFIFDDRSYNDVVFTGNQCQVPVLKNTHEVIVGVFAGNLTTTTPAYLRAQRSILCYGGEKTDFTPDQYDQIMGRMNEVETIATDMEQTMSEAFGTGGIYLVTHTGGGIDRTADEIIAAANEGKTILLTHNGRVWTYRGLEPYGDSSAYKGDAPTFQTQVKYNPGERAFKLETLQIRPDNNRISTFSYDPARTSNPFKLIIKQGDKLTEYDGSKAVTVEVSQTGGGNNTGAVHSDWSQNSVVAPDYIKNRTHYDVTHMSVALGASVEADAPSARIYRSDGSEAAVRWVKVSDHVPDAEIFISAGVLQTNANNRVGISENDIIAHTDRGYLIAREQHNTNTGRTLRLVYAAVCFEAGYKVLGYPAYESTDSTSTATLPEPGVYLPVTDSSQTTYYGYGLDTYVKPIDEKYIPDTIARKKDLENIVVEDPVTDEHINGLIDAKLAGLGGSYVLPRTVLAYDEDGFYIPGTWSMPPVVGNVYAVNYNGVDYWCEVIEVPDTVDTPVGLFVMGNLEGVLPGFTGNPDAPFVLIGLLEPDGFAGVVNPLDGAESITLSISSGSGASLPVPVDPTKTAYLRWNGTEWVASTIDQLKADLGLTNAVVLTSDGEGNVTVTGATLTGDGEGNVTLTGGILSGDGDGNVKIE